ncbi:L-ascorbate oxidase-like protein [Thalictrum thalictroides]|uniref:L-ascorbate oxidase-like protein n=1 Tax=Thalictrum thalictroides TaxID=46969 RepID=A0A7J6WHG0_THATH|nr:L-ascorbate oxidase-like protein [Thalictrum thalictroides]
MAGRSHAVLCVLVSSLAAFALVQAEDPYLFFTWNVTYGTISPMGVPQQVIMINNQFPGPNINSTSNNNIIINVFNNLDEPLLFSWNGMQHRKNSWMEGMPGTNCPIPAGKNFTYHFQPKDQIGSYFYFPSTGFQKAAGGFGGLRTNSRLLIPVPYADPEDDLTVLIGDWYTKSHTALRKKLDSGKLLHRPDGILMNGKTGKTGGKDDEPLFTLKQGKTYKIRVCNVGLKTSLNFRIQGHSMKLVEMDGSHVVQNSYNSLDVHLGQCYAVLVTTDQTPRDYYMVASTRFTKYMLSATGIIRYVDASGAKLGGPPSSALPEAPVGWAWSLNQFRSYRWNLTASAARPNPQGSYHYGQINITRTIKILNTAGPVDGKLRYGINGVSHVDGETPLKLAEYFGVASKVFKYNTIEDDPKDIKNIVAQPNVLNATFRTFIEIIFENTEKSIQSWHLDGYSFFPVAIETGKWSPEKRKNYNLLDAVSRHSIELYPKSWAAIMLTFDNAGMWNLRTNLWERYYLGQQMYFSVLSPNYSLRDEYNIPDNAELCGIVKGMPMPKPYTP